MRAWSHQHQCFVIRTARNSNGETDFKSGVEFVDDVLKYHSCNDAPAS